MRVLFGIIVIVVICAIIDQYEALLKGEDVNIVPVPVIAWKAGTGIGEGGGLLNQGHLAACLEGSAISLEA